MKIGIIGIIMVFSLSWNRVQCQVKAYPIDSWHSRIGFKVGFSGLLDVEGRFTDFHGTVMFDQNEPTHLSATVIINTHSIDTGVELRDKHLRSDDFFNVELFPEIKFSSDSVVMNANKFELVGQLHLNGKTRKVSIPFQVVHGEKLDVWQNARITLAGNLTIHRSDYALGNEESIANEVRINLLISCRVLNTKKIGLFSRRFGKEMLEKILNTNLETTKAHFLYLKNSGDTDAAKPSNFEFLFNRLMEEKMYKKAIEICKLGIEMYPDYSPMYSALGSVYYKVGQIQEAREFTVEAMKVDNTNTLAIEMNKLLKTE